MIHAKILDDFMYLLIVHRCLYVYMILIVLFRLLYFRVDHFLGGGGGGTLLLPVEGGGGLFD